MRDNPGFRPKTAGTARIDQSSRNDHSVRQVYSVPRVSGSGPRSRPWPTLAAVAEGSCAGMTCCDALARAACRRCRPTGDQQMKYKGYQEYTSGGLRLPRAGASWLAQAHHQLACQPESPPPRRPTLPSSARRRQLLARYVWSVLYIRYTRGYGTLRYLIIYKVVRTGYGTLRYLIIYKVH